MILRFQTEEEVTQLQQRIKAKSKTCKVHMTELRSNTGTEIPYPEGDLKVLRAKGHLINRGINAAPQDLQPIVAGVNPDPAVAAPLKTPSKTRQKRSQRIPGYMAESDVLKSILGYLKVHPRVSWVVRINSGALRYENRFIKFGQPGFPDVIGMTKSGVLIGIEVKASNGHASPEQLAFIARIQKDGGLGCIAKSIDDVKELLG